MNISYNKCWITLTCLLAPSAIAGGLLVNAQSANGLGRAFAGDGVIADNASVIATNPAAMSLFKYSTISFGATAQSSHTDLTKTGYGAGVDNINADAANITSTPSILPNLYWLAPINGKMRFGISLQNNFKYDTQFEDDYVASEFGGTTKLAIFQLGNAVSYKVNTKWTLGTSLNLVYGTVGLNRQASQTFNDAVFIGSPNNPNYKPYGAIADITGSGFGLGMNLGVMYRMNKRHRYALSYQMNPNLDVEGQVIRGQLNVGDGIVLKLPNILNISGFDELTPDWTIHYSAEMIQWSAMDNISTLSGLELFQYNWQNGYRLAIGGTWQYSKHWAVRGGYSYELSGRNEVKSASIPYFDSQMFSGGLQYSLDKKNVIDLGVAFTTTGDSAVNEATRNTQTQQTITSLNGLLKQRSIMVAVQFSHRL